LLAQNIASIEFSFPISWIGIIISFVHSSSLSKGAKLQLDVCLMLPTTSFSCGRWSGHRRHHRCSRGGSGPWSRDLKLSSISMFLWRHDFWANLPPAPSKSPALYSLPVEGLMSPPSDSGMETLLLAPVPPMVTSAPGNLLLTLSSTPDSLAGKMMLVCCRKFLKLLKV
jgi:hypothetical protein